MKVEKIENFEDKLLVEGVNSMGYGLMPKTVAKDTRLTIEAKAIYAYFVSYAGAGTSAFPKLKTILTDLCISEKRFYKHRKLLIDFGYISVQAFRNEKSVIYKNVYTLHTNPVVVTDGVSVKTTDGVPVKTTDRGTRQNDCDKLKVTVSNINNIKLTEKEIDDDEYKLNKPNLETENLNDILNTKESKEIAKSLLASHVEINDMIDILKYFKDSNKSVDIDIMKQQLDWMTQKNLMGTGISSFSSYFINGYEKRINNTQLSVIKDFTEELKKELGLQEEELPEIPMFNWLEN